MRLLFRNLLFLLLLSFCRDRKFADVPQAENSIKKSRIPTYEQYKLSIDSTRKAYRNSLFPQKKIPDSLVYPLKEILVKIIGEDLFSYWKGTGWDFNGTTTIPRNGKIACGYFVTTILQDMGHPVNRVELAICPSLLMMKSLTAPKSIQNLSALSFERFTERMESYGLNVFIIGLDYHTGFVVNDGKESWFIHSNYINKEGVIKERLSESKALKSSATRYITCITGSAEFLSRWLFG